MSKKVYDAVATVGTYTDKDGVEKKQYRTVGAVFENDKGMFMKLDALPLSKDWSGFISFYPPREKVPTTAEMSKWNAEQPRPTADAPRPVTANADFDDDIPFN